MGLEVLGPENLPQRWRARLYGYHGAPRAWEPAVCHQVRDADGILGFLEDVSEGLEQVLFIRVMVAGDEGAGASPPAASTIRIVF